MANVWMVTDGDYSDYHVIGVYSTEEHASFAASKFGGEVEEVILDEHIDRLKQGFRIYSVVMGDRGDCQCPPYVKPSSRDEYVFFKNSIPRRVGVKFPTNGLPKQLIADVWATSPEHALKIVNEKRIAKLAEGEWV